MSHIQMLNQQRAEALRKLIAAVKSGSNSAIDKALSFYRIPCYSPLDVGKSDSDVEYDIRKVNGKIESLKKNAIGAAMIKTGNHYLLKVVKELQTVLYLREHYRSGKLTSDAVYVTRSRDSIVESEPVSVKYAATH